MHLALLSTSCQVAFEAYGCGPQGRSRTVHCPAKLLLCPSTALSLLLLAGPGAPAAVPNSDLCRHEQEDGQVRAMEPCQVLPARHHAVLRLCLLHAPCDGPKPAGEVRLGGPPGAGLRFQLRGKLLHQVQAARQPVWHQLPASPCARSSEHPLLRCSAWPLLQIAAPGGAGLSPACLCIALADAGLDLRL